MAVNARELMLIISAQNRTRGALTSVGRDLKSLSRMQKAQVEQQRLATKAAALQNQQLQAQSKLRTLTNGPQALALQKQRVSLMEAEAKAQRDMALTSSRLATAQKTLGKFNASAVNSVAYERAANTVQMYENRLIDLQATQRKLIETNKVLSASEKELAASTATASRELSVIGEKMAALRAEQVSLNRQIRAMRWDPISKAGSIMTHLARPMQYAGLVMGAAFGYAADQAAKFNTQVGLTATQVANKFGRGAQGTVRATQQLTKGITGILGSGRATANSEDQNKAAYDIFSSMTLKGNQKAQIKEGLTLLKEFNKAAIAGQVSLPDVTHAGISILNDFGKTGDQVKELPGFLNRMFASVRFGRTTVQEFVSSMNQVAPAFSAAFGNKSSSFDEMSKAMAAITRFMPSPRMAATALARLAQQFNNPDFIRGVEKSGGKITDVRGHLKSFTDVMNVLNKTFPKLRTGGPGLQMFFKDMTALGSGKAGNKGTTQAIRAFAELIQHMGVLNKIGHQVMTDNGEFTKSYLALANTSGVKWAEFKQQMHALVLEIGEKVIPVLVRLAKPLMNAFKWFNSLSDASKGSIAKWGTYAAVGMLLGSAILFVTGNLVKLVAVLGKSRMLFGGVFGAFVGYELVSAALAGKLHSLGDAFNTVVGIFTNHGAWGWVGYFAVASYGVVRLTSALKGLAAANALSNASGAVGGAGGLLGGIGKLKSLGSDAKLGFQVSRMEGLGIGASSLAGLSTAAAGLSIALPIAAGAIALGAGGLLLWDGHMKDVAAHAALVRSELDRIDATLTKQSSLGRNLGGLGNNLENLGKARDAHAQALAQLASDRKSNQPAFTLREDHYNVVDTAMAVKTANHQVTDSYKSFNSMLLVHSQALSNVARVQKTYNRDQQDYLKMVRSYGDTNAIGKRTIAMGKNIAPFGIDQRGFPVADLKKEMNEALRVVNSSGSQIRASMNRALSGLTAHGFLKNVSAEARAAILNLALQLGQMPSLKQIKAVIKAVADPASLRKASGDIRRAVDQARTAAKNKAMVDKTVAKLELKSVWLEQPKATKAKAAATFKKPINQPIHIGPINPHAAVVGAAIDSGIAGGISQNVGIINAAAAAAAVGAVAAGKAAIKSKSPSRLAADEIGKPFVQGIAVGILENAGLLTKPVADVIGTVLGAFQQATAQTFTMFQSQGLTDKLSALTSATKDPLKVARAQHAVTLAQAALARTTKKHGNVGDTPANQQRLKLAEAALRKAHPGKLTFGDLSKDVNSQLKDLNKFNNAITKLQTRKVPRDLVTNLLSIGVSGVKEVTLLANATDKQLDHYVKAYRKAELATTKFSAVTGSAVLKNLRSQVVLYSSFNKNLENLRRRNVPKALVDQLRASGTGSEQQLVALNKMTDKQLKQFVNLWKKYTKQSKMAAVSSTADIAAATKQAQDQIVQYLTNMYQTMQQQNQSAFGTLFSGNNSVVQQLMNSNTGLGQTLQSAFGSAFQGYGASSPFDQLPQQANQLLDNLGLKVQYGGKLTGTDLQKVLDQQVSQFSGFNDDLNSLAKRGIGTGLLDELKSLGPSSKEYLDALLKDTDEQLKQYSDTWTSFTQDQLKTALDTQVSDFQSWADDIQKLIDRGLPVTLAMQLEQLGPSSKDALDTLLSETSQQLQDYADTWNRGQKLVTDYTTQLQLAIDPQIIIDDLQQQLDAFNNWQSDIQALRDAGLPEQLIQQLEALGPGADSALKALVDATAPQLNKFASVWKDSQDAINLATITDFNAQLNDWYNQGINVGDAIIQGIIDITPSILAAIKKLAAQMQSASTGIPQLTVGSDGTTANSMNDAGDASQQASSQGYVAPSSGASPILFNPYSSTYTGSAGSQLHAAGGMVTGAFTGEDSVNAKLEPGEYVLTRSDVAELKSELKKGRNNNTPSKLAENINIYQNTDESMLTALNRMFFRIRTSKGQTWSPTSNA